MHATSDLAISVYLSNAKTDESFKSLPDSVNKRTMPAFEVNSLPWFADKLSVRLGSRPWRANRIMKNDGIDIYSHGIPTGDTALMTIGWIPDFQHIHLPQLFSQQQLRAREHSFREIAVRSNRVVVSSEDAKKDLIRFAPHAESKTHVLRFAALPQDPYVCTLEELRKLYLIDRPYFYVPNQLWKHKNHDLLITALVLARNKHPDLSILCSGGTSDYRHPSHFSELKTRIRNHGLQDSIRFLGLVPYSHIAPLMYNALAVMNPSLFEGWSTTVEEAKALGLPLIVSDIPVHREQIDATADFFPPGSPEHLAELMLRHHRLEFPQRLPAATDAAVSDHRQQVLNFAETYMEIVREIN